MLTTNKMCDDKMQPTRTKKVAVVVLNFLFYKLSFRVDAYTFSCKNSLHKSYEPMLN